jgi:hypothetical protein
MLNSSCSFSNQQLRGMRQRKTGSKAHMQRTNQEYYPAQEPGEGSWLPAPK